MLPIVQNFSFLKMAETVEMMLSTRWPGDPDVAQRDKQPKSTNDPYESYHSAVVAQWTHIDVTCCNLWRCEQRYSIKWSPDSCETPTILYSLGTCGSLVISETSHDLTAYQSSHGENP